MPTLRVELLKSRREDAEESMAADMAVSRHPHLPASMSKQSEVKPPRALKEKLSLPTVKLVSRGMQGPQSSSESDSFSIASSSSSSKSEADSIEKPSLYSSLTKQKSSANVPTSSGSHFAALQDASHLASSDERQAIIEKKLHGKETSGHGVQGLSSAERRMVENHCGKIEGRKIAKQAFTTGSKDGFVAKQDCLRHCRDTSAKKKNLLHACVLKANTLAVESDSPERFQESKIPLLVGGELTKAQGIKTITAASGNPAHERRVDCMKSFVASEAGVLDPASVHETKCKANSDELSPLSPFFLHDTNTFDMHGDDCGRKHVNMSWLVTSKRQLSLSNPLKAQGDWRSRSTGARASLKSAVRNLEAAFRGSRSSSSQKMRPQTNEREQKSESFTFLGRVFPSPVVSHSDTGRTQGPENLQRNVVVPLRRRDVNCYEYRGASASSDCRLDKPGLPLPSLKKRLDKSDMSDFHASSIDLIPNLLRIRSLVSSKETANFPCPLISTPPSSALSQVATPVSCVLQAYLQCFERDGKAFYALSFKDFDEMLLAKACTVGHNSTGEGWKCIYTFQYGRSNKSMNGWRHWLRKDAKSTIDMAGKMHMLSQLCSELTPTGKRLQYWESEFVLYDQQNDSAIRSQSLRFSASSDECVSECSHVESGLSAQGELEFIQPLVSAGKGMPNMPQCPSIASTNLKSAMSSRHEVQQSRALERASHHPSFSIDAYSDLDPADFEIPQKGSYASLLSELAAIVIRMPTNEYDEDAHVLSNSACRRSLNFSENQSKASRVDHPERPRILDLAMQQATPPQQHPSCGRVTLMLPKENHGLPKNGLHRPTSLIDRWKCGGKCDCGGWDLGCGMKVFSNQTCGMHAATTISGEVNSIQSIFHKQPLVLYSQEKMQKVLLSLCHVQEGQFVLKFCDELSPLKAFAASVAILHSRDLSSLGGEWMPPMKDNYYQSVPESVGWSKERRASAETLKELPWWRTASSRAPSPYGRA